MPSSVARLLGAGFSYVAGVPLARDLLTPGWLIAVSERSRWRFTMVREDYQNWQRDHPGEFPEQYMAFVYARKEALNQPKWDWIVEYVCAVIASATDDAAKFGRDRISSLTLH